MIINGDALEWRRKTIVKIKYKIQMINVMLE